MRIIGQVMLRAREQKEAVIENKSEESINPRIHRCSLNGYPFRRLLLALLLPAIFILLLGDTGCGRKKKIPTGRDKSTKITTAEKSIEDARMTLNDYTVVVPPAGERIWVAKMHTGSADSKSGEIIMEKMSCTFYQHGKELLQASADEASAIVKGNDVAADLHGNVTAVSKMDGQSFTADALHWKSGDKVMKVEKFVFTGRTTKGENYTLRAKSGTISLDLREVNYRQGTIAIYPALKSRK